MRQNWYTESGICFFNVQLNFISYCKKSIKPTSSKCHHAILCSNIFAIIRQKPFRFEFCRLGKHFRVIENGIQVIYDCCSFWNSIAVPLHIFGCHPSTCYRKNVGMALYFTDHRFTVWEGQSVRQCRAPVCPNNFNHLLSHTFLYSWVFQEIYASPLNSCACSFDSSQEKILNNEGKLFIWKEKI